MQLNLNSTHYQKAFKLADKNKDGKVTQKEAKAAWRKYAKKLDDKHPNGIYSEKEARTLGSLVGLSALAHSGQTGKSLSKKELGQNQAFLDQNINVDYRRRDSDVSIGDANGNEHNVSSIDVTTSPFQNGQEGRGYEFYAGEVERFRVDQQGIYFNA